MTKWMKHSDTPEMCSICGEPDHKWRACLTHRMTDQIEKLKAKNAVLLEFAKKHHDLCEDCEGTGKIYNNADPTSGQWVLCPYAEAVAQSEGKP